MTSRIDLVGQNGNDGEHYLVEEVCRIIAGEHGDIKLMGTYLGMSRWQLFIPMALQIIERVQKNGS